MTLEPGQSLGGPLLAEMSQFVEARLGLYFPSERWSYLERGLCFASEECGADARHLCKKLLAGRSTQTELSRLVSHLTVGETYFLRDPRGLQVLGEHILPELKGRSPRIWSAGCSNGEEPCSIAISLRRLHAPVPDTVFATDIDIRALERAKKGSFGEWSFRSAPPWLKANYFSATTDKRWSIDPAILSMISFAYANLIESAPPEATAMDVVFCRNVLMYFSPEAAQRAVRGLYDALSVGGWLIVSPAEASHALFSGFVSVSFEGITVYRKPARVQSSGFAALPSVPFPVNQSGPVPAVEADAEPDGKHDPQLPDSQTRKSGVTTRNRGPAMLRLARWHANRGELREASDWCEKAMVAEAASFRPYYLRAAIFEEQGALDYAARSLRQALYFEPKFVVGHFSLARVTARLGKDKESAKCFVNTLDLLGACESDCILPESGGLTAEALRQLIAGWKNE